MNIAFFFVALTLCPYAKCATEGGDAPVDILWNQNFQFEVPAETNTLNLSLLIPARNSAEVFDVSVNSTVPQLLTNFLSVFRPKHWNGECGFKYAMRQ